MLWHAGQLVMGDATYNHIYNGTDSTGSVTQRLHPSGTAAPAEDEYQDDADGIPEEARAGSISPTAGADTGLDALHNAIISNTDGSAAMIAEGTPAGISRVCSRLALSIIELYLRCKRLGYAKYLTQMITRCLTQLITPECEQQLAPLQARSRALMVSQQYIIHGCCLVSR